MKGEVERSELHYIIRDHDMEKFEEKKAGHGPLPRTLSTASTARERWS